jgi:hypothetical protein
MLLDTVSLRPQVPVDMGTRKVINLEYATASDDAMAFG